MKLYIDYLSQPSRAVLWLCRMNALPVDVVEVRIARMEQRSEEFARLNPMKQVPVLEDVRAGPAVKDRICRRNYCTHCPTGSRRMASF